MHDSTIESKEKELTEKETKLRDLTSLIEDLKSEMKAIAGHEEDEEHEGKENVFDAHTTQTDSSPQYIRRHCQKEGSVAQVCYLPREKVGY